MLARDTRELLEESNVDGLSLFLLASKGDFELFQWLSMENHSFRYPHELALLQQKALDSLEQLQVFLAPGRRFGKRWRLIATVAKSFLQELGNF